MFSVKDAVVFCKVCTEKKNKISSLYFFHWRIMYKEDIAM